MFSRIPRWESYKKFFHITYFRHFVFWFSLVPILAEILKDLPSKATILINKEESIIIHFGLPFSWQLLWASSFFFVLAWGLYAIFCPYFIRKYNRYSDYTGYGHDPRHLVWEVAKIIRNKVKSEKFVNRLATKGYIEKIQERPSFPLNKPEVQKEQTVIVFEYDKTLYQFGMPVLSVTDQEKHVKAIFWELFGRYSGSCAGARLLILFLLLVSLGLFLSVLGNHICAGLEYVLERLVGQ